MEYLVVWFVMTAVAVGGVEPGYIEPQDVKAPVCGLLGYIPGVIVDKLLNPTRVMYQDPHAEGRYCEQDISAKVAALPAGEFHIATTHMGKTYAWNETPERYILSDPHTSETFIRDGQLMSGPAPADPRALRITPPPD